MNLLRVVGVLSAAVVLSLVVSDVDAAQKGKSKGKHKHHGIHGVVVSVTPGNGKDGGTLTVKVRSHSHKKGTSATVARTTKEVTFTIAKDTKIELVSRHAKGAQQVQTTAVSLASLQPGNHVRITTRGHHSREATRVAVMSGKKRSRSKAS